VFREVPGSGAHLELTAGRGHGAPAPHPEALLVLYLRDEEAVRAVAARLGVDPVLPANPCWAEHGLTFEDPDGFRVVLVPESCETYWACGDASSKTYGLSRHGPARRHPSGYAGDGLDDERYPLALAHDRKRLRPD